MTEQELRALVREAIAKQLGPEWRSPLGLAEQPSRTPSGLAVHASHGVYNIPRDDDSCIIEPSVPCTHCNYCKSHGH